eukprot:12286036-Alexandrium_andersonii.AAC.1
MLVCSISDGAARVTSAPLAFYAAWFTLFGSAGGLRNRCNSVRSVLGEHIPAGMSGPTLATGR